MGRFQMEPAPSRMAGGTSRYGLEALLFEMALLTRESHRSGRRTRVTCRTFHYQPPTPEVTLIATKLSMLPKEWPRVLEFLSNFDLSRTGDPRFLSKDRMAKL